MLPTKDKVIVPSLVGLQTGRAYVETSALNLRTNLTQAPSQSVPPGDISAQEPPAGAKVPQRTQVSVTISSGP